MASLPAVIGARSIYRTLYPIQGIIAAQDKGLLPKLDQSKAPAGYQLSYDMTAIGPQASGADALAKIQDLGGLNVAVTLKPEEVPWWKQALAVAGGLFSFTTIGGGLSTTFQGISSEQPVLKPKIAGFVPTQGGPMFQDGDSWSFSDIFSGVNQALQGGLGANLLNAGAGALTSYLNNLGQPSAALAPVASGMVVPTMASVPAVIGAGRAVATVGRGFFNKFPNLATAIQSLRNRGANNVSRGTLYSALRRFGPEMLVSGGILTAAAASELAVAGPGRRRMNAGNVKALRRAHRRMRSFHHLCSQNDVLYRRARRK